MLVAVEGKEYTYMYIVHLKISCKSSIVNGTDILFCAVAVIDQR